ncbi:MAG: ankyrin repeat domain-containing protein [Candidatus Omnitrophica bacterium]|nr:ankyrin repeat domain-containing protein [Candidatus Omnitrophota bacterium]
MKARYFLAFALFLASAGSNLASDSLSAALQNGLYEEEVTRNLAAAIQAYQSVIQQFDQDRKLAATAIFRVGECYRKQGNTNGAIGQYQRILREFPDQTVLAELSGKDLASLGVAPSAVPATNAPPSTEASAEEQEIQKLKLMVQNSPDLINARSASGPTPLQLAAEKGQLQVASFLLANHADVNAKGPDGYTALHFAVLSGNLTMVEWLLASEADINSKNDLGETPLELAASKGFLAIADALLLNHADVNAKDNSGNTPLCKAAANGYQAVAQSLIEKGADVNAGIPLAAAASNGHVDMIELLLKHGAEVNLKDKFDRTPLFPAVVDNQLSAAEFLLNHKAEINLKDSNSRTPLGYAIEKSNPMVNLMAKLLLEHGADPNLKINNAQTPLGIAIDKKNVPMVKLLLEHGADPNETSLFTSHVGTLKTTSFTPLQEVAMLGYNDMAELLLTYKANPNPERFDAPLWSAVTRNNLALAKLLLDHGADPNLSTSFGNTPLFQAVAQFNKEMVELLLTHGAKVNILNNNGQTPLSLAQKVLNGISGVGINLPPAMVVERGIYLANPIPLDAQSDLKQIIGLLRQHGANENFQRMSQISVSRKSINSNYDVFTKDKNGYNRFTLFELVSTAYCYHPFAFPDFSKTAINRLASGGEKTENIPVDLQAIFNSGDCTKDMWLDWGDDLEIPETDHKLNESWPGLPAKVAEFLQKCLERKVEIIVKGQVTKVTLTAPTPSRLGFPTPPPPMMGAGLPMGPIPMPGPVPQPLPPAQVIPSRPAPALSPAASTPQPASPPTITLHSFWLKGVVYGANVLLASSDTTRIKVTRTDPETKRKTEMTFNLETIEPNSDLWLRDGDVIEVPEKE